MLEFILKSLNFDCRFWYLGISEHIYWLDLFRSWNVGWDYVFSLQFYAFNWHLYPKWHCIQDSILSVHAFLGNRTHDLDDAAQISIYLNSDAPKGKLLTKIVNFKWAFWKKLLRNISMCSMRLFLFEVACHYLWHLCAPKYYLVNEWITSNVAINYLMHNWEAIDEEFCPQFIYFIVRLCLRIWMYPQDSEKCTCPNITFFALISSITQHLH